MGSFSTTTYSLINWIGGHGEINEVTFGDANEVDISKATEFPLAHVIPLNSSIQSGYTTYNYQVLFLDTFKSSTDSKIDVLDRMAGVAEDFVKAFHNGHIVDGSIRTTDSQGAEVIYDQRQNRLYGWSLDIEANVSNVVPC